MYDDVYYVHLMYIINDVKYITTCTNYFTPRSQMIGIALKFSEGCLFP